MPAAITPCPLCETPVPRKLLEEAHWYPFWDNEDGACPACVQQNLLRTLLSQEQEDLALHQDVPAVWPLDAKSAFGALPTPLRLHADPRFSGRGVTVAMIDSGFYPHPDLVRPRNRIRAWVDATRDPVKVLRFSAQEAPRWPGWNAGHAWQWHGLMTSTVAAGNGFLSHGLYRGMAGESDLVLIQGRAARGGISNDTLHRAFQWLLRHGAKLGVRVGNLSVGGDPVPQLAGNFVDQAATALVEAGITVVAAAGNDGQRRLLPPATAPLVLTIGGIDDKNSFTREEMTLWHSNYGESHAGVGKPELVAPSIWVAAAVLPHSAVAREARQLFSNCASGNEDRLRRIAALRLVTPHYQHVDGTSFAAPLVSSTVACMLQANPRLTPLEIRTILTATAQPVPGAPPEQQGAGALDAGQAVARALHLRRPRGAPWPFSPRLEPGGVVFALHDTEVHKVEVSGSWDGFRSPGLPARRSHPAVWQTKPRPLPPGEYTYKFLLDGHRWMHDPSNPLLGHDGSGGLLSVVRV